MAGKAKHSEHLHFEQIASQIRFNCNQRHRRNILYRHTKKRWNFTCRILHVCTCCQLHYQQLPEQQQQHKHKYLLETVPAPT